jgi:hypothetical protein
MTASGGPTTPLAEHHAWYSGSCHTRVTCHVSPYFLGFFFKEHTCYFLTHSSKLSRLRQAPTAQAVTKEDLASHDYGRPGRHSTGREKQGETYTSSGICHDGKSPAFRAKQDRESAESFSRSIALRSCFAQAQGRHPGPPVERMRSTQGRIYSGPETARPAVLKPAVFFRAL